MKAASFASLIGTTPRTVYTLIKRGEVVQVEQGNKKLVDADASKSLLASIGKLDEHGKYLPRHARTRTQKDDVADTGLDFGGGTIETVSRVDKTKMLDAYTPPARKPSEPKPKYDNASFMTDIPDDLAELIENAHNPKDITQIINNYWVGKKNRQAYEREKRELIPISEAKAVMDAVLIEVSEKMSNLPIDIKNRFPDMAEEMFKQLEWYIDHIKQSMQEIPWEN